MCIRDRGYYAEKDRAERLRTKSKELHKAVHNMYAVSYTHLDVYKRQALHRRQGRPDGKPKTATERKLLLKAGLVCGTLLFLASRCV